ncbi:uncharacterized protein EV420DRAFT_1503778 [Desarmillaria tabescens]|uniref:F-box domain-containing protein n=1 Tax=Armillaria tabescens TaxID=1929756 RepID=A0AA39TWA1_ARMTA|nr:uncharacterized protein EV420DRAFT_1503778 [Desarmillaria tabescens]KAK0468313.1 hypothetical protein EV420DRAFT_1503778 [Desarmillaria tabescens]
MDSLRGGLITFHESAIHHEVHRLQFKKSQILEKIKECKGRLTLARRLPPEILANIFELCARDGWTRTPLTVSHVCSEWRKAACTSTVWSYLYVNLGMRDPYGRILFWLANVRTAPLHITLDIQSDYSLLPNIMGLLLKVAPQWHTLTVNSKMLRPVNQIFTICTVPFPSLRCLDVSIMEEFHEFEGDVVESQLRLDQSFNDAEKLSIFRISRNILPSRESVPSSISNLIINLPSFNLITPSSVASLLDLLEGLPMLDSFTISTLRGETREFIDDPNIARRVFLPQLQSLRIIGTSSIFNILPHLQTPALLQLALCSSEEALPHAHPVASPALHLRDIDLSPSDFIACFRGLSHLKELRLHESDISDDILECLYDSRGYCPELQALDFRWCGQITGRALVDLVRSRSDLNSFYPNVPLRHIESVGIINCAHVQEQDIFDLAELTVCRLMMRDTDDCCVSFGCCRNERYRRRFQLRWLERYGSKIDTSRIIV